MASSDMVQSLMRALDILEFIARLDNGARLNEIAEGLSLKKTTAHNLIRTLRCRGYLSKDGASRYRMGVALEDMLRQRYRRDIYRRASQSMRRLQAEVGNSTVTFSELVGNEICCRLRLAPESAGVLRRPRSQSFSAFGSASGLCLQAFNSDYRDVVAAAHGFEESGARYWNTRGEFDRALADTVREGLAVVRSGSSWRLAAPVDDSHVLGLSFIGECGAAEALFDKLIEEAAVIAADNVGDAIREGPDSDL